MKKKQFKGKVIERIDRRIKLINGIIPFAKQLKGYFENKLIELIELKELVKEI